MADLIELEQKADSHRQSPGGRHPLLIGAEMRGIDLAFVLHRFASDRFLNRRRDGHPSPALQLVSCCTFGNNVAALRTLEEQATRAIDRSVGNQFAAVRAGRVVFFFHALGPSDTLKYYGAYK